jgi:hypothetical protein
MMMPSLLKKCSVFIGLSVLLPHVGFARTSGSNLSAHGTLDERAERARRYCLNNPRSVPEVTYVNPEGEWIDRYRPSTGAGVSMGVYRPLTHGLGGLIQDSIDWAFGGEDAFRGVSVLRQLGRETRDFASQNRLNRMTSLCVASCVVSEMIYGTEEIPHMLSLDLALSAGAGDCKIYSEAMLVMGEEMGISLWQVNSWTHSFNQVTYRGREFLVDATRFDGMSCNYVPVSFYD